MLIRFSSFSLLVTLFFLSLPLQSDEPPPALEPKETPVSIFSAKLGDEDVDFLMQGSWRISLSAATGLRFGPDASVLFPFGLPAFGSGFFFEQVPALTFSAWFAQRYFLEVSVLAQSADNTFLAGYKGKAGEFVQNVYIGNKSTGIGLYDFIDMPAQSKSSLGASALFTTPVSRHEVLLRYDSTREDKKVFYGTSEVSEQELPPSDFLQGRYFMLPDAAIEGLVVFLEDKNGTVSGNDGKRYRAAATTEIFQDTANGFLMILMNDFKGRIAVSYTKAGLFVGDLALGANALPSTSGAYIDPTGPGVKFDWGVTWLGDIMLNRQIIINAQTCLLLWEPGSFSPFAMCSAYDLGAVAPDDISSVRIKLIPKGAPDSSYTLPVPVYFGVTPGQRIFTAYQNLSKRTDFRNHFPFPDPDHQLYGPVRDHLPPFFDYGIFVQMPTGIDRFVLEDNVVPGSIRVKRNGIDETRFVYDENTYTLTFTTPIYPYDRIEVFYRVSVAEKNAGDLLFAWGNKIPFAPLASLDLALGLRWNILPGAYTERAYAKTGAVVFSSTLHGESDVFSYRLAGALSYTNPDTTGVMRLAGMEGQGLIIEPDEDLASPSAKPDSSEIAGLGSRGRLFYKDYREYDALGGVALMGLDWTPPAAQIWSYANASKCGPYNVAGDSASANGRSLVLDFELDNLNGWVGVQIPFSYNNSDADLSRIRSIIASLRAVELSGAESINVYIQIGACKEDVDEDGILDAEFSTLTGGYSFNDSTNFVTLLVGGGPKNEGNGIINSEDINGNGTLDTEAPSYIFTNATPIQFNADTAWSLYTMPLLSIDQEKLKRVRAIRIIVVSNAAVPVNARLLMDKIVLAGNSFWSMIDPGAAFTAFNVREVSESFVLPASVLSLSQAYPEVRDTFHSAGETQEVLAIDWAGGTGTRLWTVKTALGSGSEGIRYRRLNFYLYRDSAFGGDLSFSLKDVADKGAVCTIHDADLVDNTWQKITLDLFEKKAYVNDSLVSSAVVTVDADYNSLLFFSLSVATNAAAHTLLIDEIHLRDPDGRIGAGASLTTTLKLKGTLVSIGEVPVFSDLVLNEDLTAHSGGFSTLYARPQDEASMRSSTSLKTGIFFADLSVDILADGVGDEWTFSGSHILTVPRTASPVVFTDRYTLESRALGPEFSREDSLLVSLPKLFRISLDQNAYSRESLLDQTWTGNFAFAALLPYQFSAAARFHQSTANFSQAESWYLDSWLKAYEYYKPWTEGSPLERSFHLEFDQTLASTPVGVKLLYTTGYASYDVTTLSHHQRDDMSLILSFPISVGSLVVEPSYTRTLSALDTVLEEGDLGRDVAWHFLQYDNRAYFFTYAPLYEIFSPDVNADFIARTGVTERTSYKPEIGLNLRRQFGSSLADLFIPSQIVFSYGKEYIQQYTLFNAFEKLSVNVLFNSINLFGKKGSCRIVDLYAIDSFATSFRSNFTLREDRWFESSLFEIESAYSFEEENGNKLSLRNLFSIDNEINCIISDKGGIDFAWQIKPKDGIALPLISEKVAKKGFIAHKESIEFQFYNMLDTSSAHPVAVVLKHETSLQFPDFGYLRGEIALGADWESSPEQIARQDTVITGIRLTIELNVKF